MNRAALMGSAKPNVKCVKLRHNTTWNRVGDQDGVEE